MKSLAALAGDLIEIESIVEERLGELDEMLAKELDQVINNLETETDHYNFRLERLAHAADFWKDKANEYYNAAKRIEKHQEDLKDRIEFVMSLLAKKKITGKESGFKFVMNPPKVDVFNEKLVPEIYTVTKTVTSIDKTKIREDLKKGKEIPGARLVQEERLKSFKNIELIEE